MSEPITLVLPLPPRLTNSAKGRSRHWRAMHKEKLAFWHQLDLLQAMGQIPRPKAVMERAEMEVTLYLWNPMDDGNAFARLKWVEDWMRVRGGFLRDDSRKHLKHAGIPEQVIDRTNPRIEITIRAA